MKWSTFHGAAGKLPIPPPSPPSVPPHVYARRSSLALYHSSPFAHNMSELHKAVAIERLLRFHVPMSETDLRAVRCPDPDKRKPSELYVNTE